MFRRNFFGAGPWDRARGIPTARLAGRLRLGQPGGVGCKVPGSEDRPVFQQDPTTKICGVSWMSTATTPYPDCVQAPSDYPDGGFNGWIPPSCMPAAEPAQIPPELPPTTPPESPQDYYPVGGECPAGQVWNGSACVPSPPATQVSPGDSVPIVPGPFPAVAPPPNIPVSPGPMPSAAPLPVPQKGFAPATIRPMCQPTAYKVHMFSPTTVATRPDQFVEKQQWTT